MVARSDRHSPQASPHRLILLLLFEELVRTLLHLGSEHRPLLFRVTQLGRRHTAPLLPYQGVKVTLREAFVGLFQFKLSMLKTGIPFLLEKVTRGKTLGIRKIFSGKTVSLSL